MTSVSEYNFAYDLMYRNRAAYYTNDYRFAHYYLTISYIYVYIHTHEFTYMYSISSSVHHVVRESIPIHMYMTILSRLYIHIYVYIYIYIFIHIHRHILIFYNYCVHTQDRHVQRRSPRHQLYEVLGMSHNPIPATE